MATRPCYTFHSSFSYLYYLILSCYMFSSCTFHILSSCAIDILHIHLYVLILSYTLCFRILFVLFLCWLKANTFILKGPNPSFLFLTRGTLPALLRIQKKNLSFHLNLFKRESVERTHLYNYVFPLKSYEKWWEIFFFFKNIKPFIENLAEFPLFFGHVPIYNICNKTI